MSIGPYVLKLGLLLVAGASFQVSYTPPNPPAKKKARGSFFEEHVHEIAHSLIVSPSVATQLFLCAESRGLFFQYVFWLGMAIDALATLMPAFNEMGFSAGQLIGEHILCPSRGTTDATTTTTSPLLPSATFISCTLLLALSAVGRAWCFRTLGRQFRFEVSIQEKHRLVTSGPYAFVRHPSYLALYGTNIGSVGLLCARGSWTRECVLGRSFSALMTMGLDITHYIALACLAIWVAGIVLTERKLAGRLVWEEEVLSKEFGKDWDEYARRVRWRILPGIF